MKKYIMLIASICLLLFSLAACSNSKTESSNENKVTDEALEEKGDLQEDDEENNKDRQESEEENGASKWGKDELNLAIGDTGTVHNNFSKTEITLDSIEIIRSDQYEEPYREQYVVTHMTVNNIGDQPVAPEDVFGSTDLAKETQAGGNMWGDVEGWPDEIGVGEKASGPLVFDVEKSKRYTLEMNYHLSSLSNKTSFVFDAKDTE